MTCYQRSRSLTRQISHISQFPAGSQGDDTQASLVGNVARADSAGTHEPTLRVSAPSGLLVGLGLSAPPGLWPCAASPLPLAGLAGLPTPLDLFQSAPSRPLEGRMDASAGDASPAPFDAARDDRRLISSLLLPAPLPAWAREMPGRQVGPRKEKAGAEGVDVERRVHLVQKCKRLGV